MPLNPGPKQSPPGMKGLSINWIKPMKYALITLYLIAGLQIGYGYSMQVVERCPSKAFWGSILSVAAWPMVGWIVINDDICRPAAEPTK